MRGEDLSCGDTFNNPTGSGHLGGDFVEWGLLGPKQLQDPGRVPFGAFWFFGGPFRAGGPILKKKMVLF